MGGPSVHSGMPNVQVTDAIVCPNTQKTSPGTFVIRPVTAQVLESSGGQSSDLRLISGVLQTIFSSS